MHINGSRPITLPAARRDDAAGFDALSLAALELAARWAGVVTLGRSREQVRAAVRDRIELEREAGQ